MHGTEPDRTEAPAASAGEGSNTNTPVVDPSLQDNPHTEPPSPFYGPRWLLEHVTPLAVLRSPKYGMRPAPPTP